MAILVSFNATIIVAKILECKISEILKNLASSFFASGLMIGALLIIKWSGYLETNISTLILYVLLGIIVFGLGIVIVDKSYILDVSKMIFGKLSDKDP